MIPEIVGGGAGAAALGAALVMVVRKLRPSIKVKFGNNGDGESPGPGAPGPGWHETVTALAKSQEFMAKEIGEIKAGVIELFKTTGEMRQDIAFMKGKLDQ